MNKGVGIMREKIIKWITAWIAGLVTLELARWLIF